MKRIIVLLIGTVVSFSHTSQLTRIKKASNKDSSETLVLLFKACSNGKTGQVKKLLLQEGITVEATFNEGVTLLHLTSQGGYHKIVKLLLAKGALANKPTIKGYATSFGVPTGSPKGS